MDEHELNKAVWAAGEWEPIAALIAGAGPRLLDDVPVGPGLEVLDVATGSGSSIAIPAAQRGATVVGCDLTPGNLVAAQRGAEAADVGVEWVEANAQDLPFDDDRFDRVFSTFGHMFAPDQVKAGAELIRVCKPGGTIAIAAWTPDGAAGGLLEVIGRYLPVRPGSPSADRWGDPDEVRRLLPGIELRFHTDAVVIEFPTVEEYAEFYAEKFGPMVVARRAVGDRWQALYDDVLEFYRQTNTATDGTSRASIEYLVTIGTKS
ncbi:class I SAM-dependent methyltransferase [Kribbella qitaiheensis]|uniref:Class I SAM-dependent methyltransferase n=1 Tax=Kribbella qitaiheensis TaxID=1544730 RepID=A0A7G6WUV0_9ACTN|nr:class I SAM-dependent methyltransferase [Kribbella qitaiheensis]QNE17765.1 class I SAM-dependent methyltransferase [Kribbella qitaiheensis]